ncbi:MAG TPA: hypothetical protein PKH07_00125, partial [bacterium]|nr:hypothetical protein [bacterium]
MKIKRRYLVLGVLFLLLAVIITAATLSVERIAKKAVSSALASKNLDGGFETLDIGLLRGVCAVGGLDLNTKDGQPLLELKRVQANVNLFSLLRKKISVDGLVVEGMKVNVQIDQQGKINWLNLLEKAESVEEATKEPSSASGSVAVRNVTLQDIVLEIEDLRPDTMLKSVSVALGNLDARLSRGKISLRNLKIESSDPQPYFGVDSIEMMGKFLVDSGVSIRVDSVTVAGVKGRNRLQDNGKFVVQQWAEDIASLNGLMSDKPVQPKPASGEKSAEMPTRIQLADLDYALVYAGSGNKPLVERIQIASLALALKDGKFDLEGLDWSQSLDKGVGDTVVHLGSLSLTAELLKSPLTVEGAQIKDLSLSLRKGVDAPFDIQQRLTTLQQKFPQKPQEKKETAPTEKAPFSVRGSINLDSVRLRLVAQETEKILVNQIVQLGSMTFDPAKGFFGLNGLVVSDDKGNMETPSLRISSVEVKGNLDVPLPEKLQINQVSVNAPSTSLACSSDGKIDLLERMDVLTRTAPKPKTPPAAKKSESSLNLELKQLAVSDLSFSLVHQVKSEQQVTFRMHQGVVNLTDLVLPKGGSGTTRLSLKGAFVQPSAGSVDLSSEIPQQSFADDFVAKFLMSLSDITPLKPYYEESMPFELKAGGFAFQTEGQCKARNL